MTIKLCIKLWEEEEFPLQARDEILFKTNVPWACVPPINALIQAGEAEDGERSTVNARVSDVYWGTDGVVWVEAPIKNLRGEYDDVRDDLVRDGFVSYAEMKAQDQVFAPGEHVIDVNELVRGIATVITRGEHGKYLIEYPDGLQVVNVPGEHLRRESA